MQQHGHRDPWHRQAEINLGSAGERQRDADLGHEHLQDGRKARATARYDVKRRGDADGKAADAGVARLGGESRTTFGRTRRRRSKPT